MKRIITLLCLITMLISCKKNEDKLVGKWESFIVGFGNTPEYFKSEYYVWNNLIVSKGVNGLIIYNGSKLCKDVFFDDDELSFSVNNELNGYDNFYYYKLKCNKNGDFLNGECSIFSERKHMAITYLIKCKKINY